MSKTRASARSDEEEDDVETRTEMPVRALAARYYTAPEVFDAVGDKLFYRSWQFACHASRVAEPGDYFAFSVLHQDLFVIRGGDGVVRCFFNVCQHRGHVLLQGSGRTRVVVCPYHAWSYALDGKLRNVSRARDIPGFDRLDIGLPEVKVEVFCGFIFVNFDPQSSPMSSTFAGVERAVRALCPDIEERAFAHEHDIQEQCNWLVAIENYNECYHCKVVHPTFASGVIDTQSYNIRPFGTTRCLHHTAGAQSGGSAWYDTSGSDYGSFFLWPSFSLQIYPSGLVNTYQWQPLAVDQTRVYRGWYSRDGVVDESLQKVIELDRDTTFAEDLVLMRNVQRGLNSMGYRPGPLVVNSKEGIDSEHSIAKLHEWVRETFDD
jgi:phenylpropionate dioxygenase-like ring-hydroxylating dioxygenase large terminal subunit